MQPESSAASKQLHWLEEMESIEQEVFPDARPRSEVVVPCTCPKDVPDPVCPIHGEDGVSESAQGRCDKCGTPKAQWAEKPCVKSLTQSPRHTITRFHIPIPEAESHV